MWRTGVVLYLLAALGLVQTLNFDDFGAISDEDTWRAAQHNARALLLAVDQANSTSAADRTVSFPGQKTYFLTNVTFDGLVDVTFDIASTIRFSNQVERYNLTEGGGNTSFLMFSNCKHISLIGSGTIDGQGLEWWRLCYLGIDHRPNLLEFLTSQDILVSGLRFLDSPRFSINLKYCADVVIHDITIFVDSAVTRLGNRSSEVYPLNTDGIDIAAVNVTVYNANITNYDDAIVVKPCRHTFTYCRCAGDVLAYNNTITYSTGLAIGSVPPHEDHNCVRNVTFRDSQLRFPLKAIYVKTNPGRAGTGEIRDITYQNIRIDTALWWTVWIGPQQQNQPGQDSDSTGCNFLFPYVPVCPTQPRVFVRDVTLRDIAAVNTLPLFQGPGVVLCNRTNPCTGFVFDNVVNTPMTGDVRAVLEQLPIPAWWLPERDLVRFDGGAFAYITSDVYAEVVAPVEPAVCVDPECFWSASV